MVKKRSDKISRVASHIIVNSKYSKLTIWQLCFLSVFLLLALLSMFILAKNELPKIRESNSNSLQLYSLIEWVKINTDENEPILVQWTLGPFIYGMADRNVIATSKVYPSEVGIVAERYSDLARFFFSDNENDAFRIINKYNISYVIVPADFDFNSCTYVMECDKLDKKNETLIFRLQNNFNLENFRLVYNSEKFKVYKVLPYFLDNFSDFDFMQKGIDKYRIKKSNKEKSTKVVGSVVPHDILHASNILNENLDLLAGNYKRIIIIGPDHRSIGGYQISTSDLIWQGFDELAKPDLEGIKKLGIPVDNGLHRYEWSVRTLIPHINYWQPDAKIIPILFRNDLSNDEAVKFGKKLASILDENSLLIASIDFSHIRPANPELSEKEDKKSLNAISEFRKNEVYSLIAEGRPALVTFLVAMEEKNAKNVRLLNISSQSYPIGDTTQSVGYISLHYSK